MQPPTFCAGKQFPVHVSPPLFPRSGIVAVPPPGEACRRVRAAGSGAAGDEGARRRQVGRVVLLTVLYVRDCFFYPRKNI